MGIARNGDSTSLLPARPRGSVSARNLQIAPQPSSKKASSQGFAPYKNGSSLGLHPASQMSDSQTFARGLTMSLHGLISDEAHLLRRRSEGRNGHMGKMTHESIFLFFFFLNEYAKT